MTDDATPTGLILVVEDEPVLLMLYQDAVEDAGWECRTADTLDTGMIAAADDVSVAILDIRLGRERVFEVAHKLLSMRIPFLFCSGTGEDMPEGAFSDVLLVPKPASPIAVVKTAIALIGG